MSKHLRPRLRRVRHLVGSVLCLLGVDRSLAAQAAPVAAGGTQDSTTVVPGPQFSASGVVRWLGPPLFGSRYRALWKTPLTLPILDLATEAGGLREMGEGTGRDVGVLYLQGANGDRFEFWPLTRSEPRPIPSYIPQSIGEGIVADFVSARNPAGPLVAAPLAKAAGVPNRPGWLVVMPDDSALGPYRSAFGQQPGYLVRGVPVPDTSDGGTPSPGTVLGSRSMLHRLRLHKPDRVDARAVLHATLFNIYLGILDPVWLDWQWRAEPDSAGLLWVPLGLYREDALARYDGIATYAARTYYPDLVKFGPKYKHWLAGLSAQVSVYEWILGGLEKATWDSIGMDLQTRLTDSVIAVAVAQMPQSYQEQVGEDLTNILRKRRDNLPSLVRNLYDQLRKNPEIRATDGPDFVIANWIGHDTLRVGLEEIGNRSYSANDTKVVDVFLHAGHDTIQVRTNRGQRPLLRIVPGGGTTTVIVDSAPARGLVVNDPDTVVQIVPPNAAKVDRERFADPLTKYDSVDEAQENPGYRYTPTLWFEIASGVGVLLGGGVYRHEWDGKTKPYKSLMRLRVGYGTVAQSGAVEFNAWRHWENSPLLGKLYAAYTGLSGTYFYGIGNETADPQPSDFYLTKQKQFIVAPALALPFARHATITGGAIAKSVSTPTDTNHFVGVVQPYGSPLLGEAGFTGQLAWDTRDVPGAPRKGVYAFASGVWYPFVWSGGSKGFGVIQGAASTYLTPGFFPALTIATRVAGGAGIGTIPYFEQPFIGGSNTVRGLPQGRYQGDQAVYANLDLRLRLTRLQFVMPWDFGLLVLGDVGRVFVTGQSSDVWHPSYGVGLWAALLDRTLVGNANLATGAGQGVFFRLGGGFVF